MRWRMGTCASTDTCGPLGVPTYACVPLGEGERIRPILTPFFAGEGCHGASPFEGVPHRVLLPWRCFGGPPDFEIARSQGGRRLWFFLFCCSQCRFGFLEVLLQSRHLEVLFQTCHLGVRLRCVEDLLRSDHLGVRL